MITVRVEFLLCNDRRIYDVCLDNGHTVQNLVEKLDNINIEDYIIIVNGTNRLKDYILKDGDKVQFFPVMSGG